MRDGNGLFMKWVSIELLFVCMVEICMVFVCGQKLLDFDANTELDFVFPCVVEIDSISM